MSRTGSGIEQWDRYWAYGNIHSFSQVSGGNYRGAIAAFWQGRIAALASASRILDIATGNGAIPLLALVESDRLGRDYDIVGVDLADIDPPRGVQDPSLKAALERVRFHGRTPAEALPLDDQSVDLACSQFGVEYSDLSRSVPEIARVLRPAGRLAVIAHHRDSALFQAARDELVQLDFVLDEARVYLRARNLLRALPAGGRTSPKVQKKRQALEAAMARVEQEAAASPAPKMLLGPMQYIREILTALERGAPAGELLKWLDEALARVMANRRRLVDMQEAAMSDDELGAFAGLLDQAGFSGVETAPFREEDGTLLGWRIEARRRD